MNNDLITGIDVETLMRELPPVRTATDRVMVRMVGVEKYFEVGEKPVEVIKGIDLELYEGEFVIIYGPSGCGKSTLLHTMLGLEEPTRGEVYLGGKKLYAMDEDHRSVYRAEKVGMVFQRAEWIKALNVWENVGYPLYLMGRGMSEVRDEVMEQLGRVGMMEHAYQQPSELSGGQQQRVAMARALISQPEVLVADEPTGNLDTTSGTELMRLLAMLNREEGRTVIMVTHDLGFLPLATKKVGMVDGRVRGEAK